MGRRQDALCQGSIAGLGLLHPSLSRSAGMSSCSVTVVGGRGGKARGSSYGNLHSLFALV